MNAQAQQLLDQGHITKELADKISASHPGNDIGLYLGFLLSRGHIGPEVLQAWLTNVHGGPALPVPQRERGTTPEIRVGDEVVSFDFAAPGLQNLSGPRASFVVGIVEAVGGPCHAYTIRVTRAVRGGADATDLVHPYYVYPPVNGTESVFGPTDGVIPRPKDVPLLPPGKEPR